MRLRKFKGFSPAFYKIATGVLLAIVIAETSWLMRMSSEPHKTIKTSSKGVSVQTKKKAIKKAPSIATPARTTTSQPAGSRGKIAIIVDDSGYNIHDCDHLQAIRTPVTISILPDLNHSMDIAKCAHSFRKEVMLHLPLEPHENSDEYPKNYIINTKMPKGLVLDRLDQSLRSVPYAEGINNHMGSKATENRRLMSIIFAELDNRKLFFVDSRVTAKTICPDLARQTGLPFAHRDVFLDNVNQRPEIEQQFAELARVAEKNGIGIGIGHARTLTWDIIKEQTEKLTQDGFEIVTIKSILSQE